MKELTILLVGSAVAAILHPWLTGHPLARLGQARYSPRNHFERLLTLAAAWVNQLEKTAVSALGKAGRDRFSPPVLLRLLRLCAGAVAGALAGILAGAVVGAATAGSGSRGIWLCWWGAGIGACALGLGPEWKERRQKKRLGEEIRHFLPEFLDILVICCQAGLNLRLGLERAAGCVEGQLGNEVRIRLDALPPARLLSDLAQKCNLTELRMVAAAIWQGDVLGLPTAQVLREQAEEVREAYRQRARAAAATIPLKLSLCTVCFFLPAVLLLVLLPQLMVFLARW